MSEFNFEALNQGASAVPASVQASLDAFDQLHQNGKIADAMVKANPNMLQGMGYQSPEQFMAQSARDKIAATTGYFKAQGAQEAMMKAQDYQAQMQQRQQQVTDDQSVGEFLGNYGKAPDTMKDANGVDQPLTPQQKFQWALQNTPNMSGRNIPRAIDSITKWQQANEADNANNPVQVDNTSIPNNAIVTRKRGSGFQVIPTGGVQTQMVDDGNGGQVPVIIGPKGQPQQLRGGSQLAPRDALTTYNANQKRMAEIAQQIKMAKNDPDVGKLMDPDALQTELEDLQGQNAKLKTVWAGGAATTKKPAAGAAAAPAAAAVNPDDVKFLLQNPNPKRIANFESVYGKGAADQYLP